MTIDINDLTFGVELEVIMPRTNHSEVGRAALAVAMNDAGVLTRHEIYNHRTRDHWKIVTDGSIGHENAEIVSPILRGESGFANLRTAVTAIDAFGCRVNRSTGLHVHVGARGLFDRQVGFFKELVRTYSKFEPVLDSIVAVSRRATNNTYCQPVRWREEFEEAGTIDDLCQMLSRAGVGRFTKLNLNAWGVHGTVEFRQHQGSTNCQKIENWVRLCLRLVSHAAKNTEENRERPRSRTVLPQTSPPQSRDLSRGTNLRGEEIPRFIRERFQDLMDMNIVSVTERTHRREGTAGREHHDNHNVWARDRIQEGNYVSLWNYRNHGGLRTHLAWDVDHGYVRVVRRSTAPVIEETTLVEVTAPPVVETPPVPVFQRPDTDGAPTTLEGLLDLLDATPAERTYFIERQMELNAN